MNQNNRILKLVDIIFFILAIIHAVGYFVSWWLYQTEDGQYSIIFLLFYICFKLFFIGLQKNKENKENTEAINEIKNYLKIMLEKNNGDKE